MAVLNFSSSVVRRESRSKQEVVNELMSQGWEQTGSMGNRVSYLENGGISISVVSGPMGSVIVPSGPIRGRLFGQSGLNFGMMQQQGMAGPDIRRRLPDIGGSGGPLGNMGVNRMSMNNNNGNNNNNGSSNNQNDSEEEVEPEQPMRKSGRSSGTGDFV
jgi:hypothetical protein